MLENIREKSQGLTAKIILGLIILTFAVAGVGNYTNSADTSVANVNGESISQQEFNQAYKSQRNRMAQQFGDMFETLSNDSNYMANFRQSIIDNLINEKLIDQSSDALAIRVSDKRLKDTIREMPEFQIEGVFDNNRYLAIINQAGFYQSSNFRDYLRVEMSRRQLSQALVASEFNLPYQEELQLALQNQTRDIRFATIAAEQFKLGIDVSTEEISNYYLANQVRFENKEQVKVDYISLNVADIAKDIKLTDNEIKQYYQENMASYTQNAQRRVSHILIEFANDEAVAKEAAEAILVRLEQGEDFASLAENLSNDTYSGENGGDLEWLEPGVMEESFDAAAMALVNVGDITPLVQTSFGYHVIQLTDFKPSEVQSFDDVKDELLAKLTDDQARDKFFALQQDMARVSFEYPDSLDDAANEIDVLIQTSPWLSRTGNLAPFAQDKTIEAAFSSLVLEDNMNSDVIEINDDIALVLRLNIFQEAKVKPLVEVEAQITTLLIGQKATKLAQDTVSDLLVKFKAGTEIANELLAIGATFESKAAVGRYTSDVAQNIIRAAFVLPHPFDGVLSASSVSLSNGDLALIEVKAVQLSDNSNATPELSKQQTSQLAQAAYSSYVDSLKVDAEITLKAVSIPENTY